MKHATSHEIIWLFDIDGTLIRSGGAGGVAMGQALNECFDVPPVTQGVSFAGRTDRGIVEDLFALHAIEASESNIGALFAAYLRILPAALEEREGDVLPGVLNWLEKIVEQGGALGLLTGNMFAAAEIKLRHFQLWDFFSFGGYGDQQRERHDVAGNAIDAAKKSLNRSVDRSRVWVVGDTPHDVSCAKSQQLNVLAVATGGHSSEELLSCEPDIVVKTLHDDAVLCRILAGQGHSS